MPSDPTGQACLLVLCVDQRVVEQAGGEMDTEEWIEQIFMVSIEFIFSPSLRILVGISFW